MSPAKNTDFFSQPCIWVSHVTYFWPMRYEMRVSGKSFAFLKQDLLLPAPSAWNREMPGCLAAVLQSQGIKYEGEDLQAKCHQADIQKELGNLMAAQSSGTSYGEFT